MMIKMDRKTSSLSGHLSKEGNKLRSSAIDSPLLSYSEFRRLLGQEIKRSERYCEYLSLLIIDFSSLVKRSCLSTKEKIEVTLNVGERVKRSIRETDFVSPLGPGRLALMLAGTPREGAEFLASKLKDGILPILSPEIGKNATSQIRTMIISYPEAGNGRHNLLNFINSYILLG